MRRAFLALSLAACGDGREPPKPPIAVYAAASLARPLAILADSFRAASNVPVRAEFGGSLELSRRITDLGATPDVILLADDEVIAALMPAHVEWYVRFATSRLVVAYTGRSPGADSMTTESWPRVLTRAGVSIGRADSAIAPAGRHALRVLRRASDYYSDQGLSARLLERSTVRYVRPNATELAALLEAGEVDFILEYESVARQYGFRYVPLPADLAPAVLYGAAIPRAAPRTGDATAFVAFLLGDRGTRLLRAANVEAMGVPVALGRNIPPEVSALVRTVASHD